jgi:hypothetical protein
MILTEIITTGLSKLVWSAVKPHVDRNVKDFLAKRRIERAVHEAVDRVVVEFERFLVDEVRDDRQRELVIELSLLELDPLVRDPAQLFRGSLDGQRVFEQLYPDGRYPEAITDERLESVWTLFVPRVAALLCELAMAIEEWRIEGWREGFRRLDEVAQRLVKLQADVDALVRRPAARSDDLFERVRRLRRQRRELSVEVTGLGGEAPVAAQLDAMFVHPAFVEAAASREQATVEDADGAIGSFLESGARTVIIAAPGAGKTTWTKWIERQVEGRTDPALVVRIEVRRYASSFPAIQKLVRDESGAHFADELDANTLRSWFESGRIHVLVDGMDELAPDARESAIDWLVGLSDAVGAGAVVLTSRPLTTDHLERLSSLGWTTWNLVPFDESRVCAYIERWYRYAPLLPDTNRTVDAESLASEWSNDPTLENLTSNPLLLSTLLTVHHLDGHLPAGRARLYQRYLSGMLGSWDARRKVEAPRVQLDTSMQRRILRDIAIFMNISARDAVEEAEIEPVVAQALRAGAVQASALDVLEQLRERSGLLIGPGIWSFAHKSIGEFLLAEVIVDGNLTVGTGERLDRMWLYQRRHEDRLNTTLFLWAGLVPASELESVIEMLLKGSDDDRLLGFGLAYDQFERLGEARRRDVAVALARMSRINSKSDVSWSFPFSAAPGGPPTGGIPLRCVSDDVYSDHLLNRLAQVGAISWDDVKDHQGPARDWLWISGERPAWWYEADDTKAPSPPDSAAPDDWWAQAVWHGIRPVTHLPGSLQERLNKVVKRNLTTPGRTVLLLMASSIYADIIGQSSLPYVFMIASLENTEFDLHWLAASDHVQVHFKKDFRFIDLTDHFATMLDGIQASSELSGSEEAAAIAACRKLNARLVLEREQLMKSREDDPQS